MTQLLSSIFFGATLLGVAWAILATLAGNRQLIMKALGLQEAVYSPLPSQPARRRVGAAGVRVLKPVPARAALRAAA